MWHIYWHISPIDVHQVIWAYEIYMWHLRSVSVPGTFCSSLVIYVAVYWFLMNLCRNLDFICRLQWKHNGAHMYYVTGIFVQGDASNVVCMHASGHGHIFSLHWVHMQYIYWHSCLISLHEAIVIFGIWGHICCGHIYAYSMIHKVAFQCLVWLICAVVLGLHVDYY